MSLARQIVMLLDLATEPLSVRTLVAQITALGGDVGAEAVHKRMHQMKAAGQARKDGDGWVLVDALPLQNLRAKWARDGQPAQIITQAPAVAPPPLTLRQRIVQALRARPGITAKELAAELGDLAGSEPASTLNILSKQGRVRHEGEWPARRYFACDDSQRKVLPRAGKRKKSGADSGLTKPADAQQTLPNSELDAMVQAWMDSHGAWAAVREVSAAIQQDTSTVAASLARLCDAGTVIWRYVSALQRGKQYAPAQGRCVGDLQPTPPTSAAAGAVQALDTTAPVHDVQIADISPTTPDDGLRELAARESLAHAAHHALETLQDACNVVDQLVDEVDGLAKAIGGDPATLPGYARCIALDLEDAIGRACDQAAPHAAIKALSVALGSTWRAISQLSPGA